MAVEKLFGAEVAWVADPAPGPSKILAHNIPTVPNLGDIQSIVWEDTPPVDILTAGFPCQPVSNAGSRDGIDDDRWIFDDITRGIERLPRRPHTLVFENVLGLLTASQGEAMRRVVHGLAEIGYMASWKTFRAADVGAPHPRARVFFLARDTLRERPRVGAANRGGLSHPQVPSPTCSPDQEPDRSLSAEGPPHPYDPDLWGRFTAPIRRWEQIVGRPAPYPAEAGPKGPRISILFLEWMMGLPQGWVSGVPDLTHAQQRKALGNGVVPQQALAALEDLTTWPTPE